MAHRYTDAEFNFIKNNCKGITTYELTEIFNKHFNSELTRSQIKNCMTRHRLTSDIDRKKLSVFHPKKYTEEQVNFIRDNVKGKTTKKIAEIFNIKFELDIKESQIKSFLGNNGLSNGVDCKFKNGSTPFNKGMKGVCPKGSEKGWFKKGTIPPNHREVGSERVTVDGYTEVKVAEPNKWKLKQRIIWEEHNGNIPKGYLVLFGDKNKLNFAPDNLILVSRAQLVTLNKNKLIQNNAELTRTGVIIADLYCKISGRK